MSHEQSETIQSKSGKWVNVYGRKTAVPGRKLPGTREYGSEKEAVTAAISRSRATPRSAEQPLRMQQTWERAASEPVVAEHLPKGVSLSPSGDIGNHRQREVRAAFKKPIKKAGQDVVPASYF